MFLSTADLSGSQHLGAGSESSEPLGGVLGQSGALPRESEGICKDTAVGPVPRPS